MDITLRRIYKTKFAEDLINSHANNAKEEMRLLDIEFNRLISE